MSCRLKFDFNDDLGNGTSYGAVNKADRLLEYNRAMQLMWIYKSLPDFRGGIVDGTEPSQKVVRLDIPVFDESAREDGTFARDDFAYDPETDIYLCPAGKVLTSTRTLVNDGATLLYRASKRDCDICELKPRCCRKMPARKVPRSIYESARDVARGIARTGAYVTSRRERKKIEMLFAHLKRILRLGRLRLRGPCGAHDEFLLAATAQNLRKLAKLIPAPAPMPA
jgi:hypothetical protein